MRTTRHQEYEEAFRFSSERAGNATSFDSVYADERIGGPVHAARRQSMPWLGIVTAISACVYLIFFRVGFEWPNPVHAAPQAATAAPAAQAEAPASELEQYGPVLAATSVPSIVTRETPAGDQVEQPEAQPDQVTVETEPPGASPNETAESRPVEPLPPPVVNKDDPYEVRALAAGLHPGLSRSLLVRLTKTDFKNAAHAIRTAIAKTPDDKVFVWPRGRSKKVTRFQVRFVPSISRDCRRYIVEVIKDGWVTTAQAMEKCGQKPLTQAANARAKKSSR